MSSRHISIFLAKRRAKNNLDKQNVLKPELQNKIQVLVLQNLDYKDWSVKVVFKIAFCRVIVYL